MSSPAAPEECPVCGCPVARDSLACPECGACHETGWKEESGTLFEEEQEFDYAEFIEKEFSSRPENVPKWVWAVGIVILLALVLRAFRG